MGRGRTLATLLPVLVLALTACGQGGFAGIYDMPLPGGADLGPHPYRVTAEFHDVLDLVPQASVRVNDVAVGKVATVRTGPDGWTADVVMEVNEGVALAPNATAELRQSSLLGEKYVELANPAKPAPGRLSDGARIPLDRTNRNPEVEEVLGALSMLINGGGIGQIQNIVQELNRALGGNEADLRELNTNLDRFTGELDRQKGEIVRAIDGLNRLSASLSGQNRNIATALDNLGPGLKVLNEQRGEFVTMLQSMDRLSQVAVDTVNRSRDDTVANLKALSPILGKLAEAGDNLPKSLQMLVTYPFTDYSVNIIKGDYANLAVKLDADFDSIVDFLLASGSQGPAAPKGPPPAAAPPPLPLPGSPAPGVPPLPAPPGQPGDLLGNLLGGTR
ncbi:MCE family protein [Gandjariella thermophila]|uniref:ABC transporter substrate-binding protein n=1 Tax=Gandjariella thermophila TaxID=1931992 RepID=A0A4D4J8C2_9PSEU|nr:MCE family protein [Gandjariella thermophila]GDY31774.1 ABC transporter substrate-binding protein [Gandjariella thermophila]